MMREVPVKADVTGTVWKIETRPGAAIAEGDALMILESMKMEIPVLAPEAGMVVAVFVAENDAVAEGQVVATLGVGTEKD